VLVGWYQKRCHRHEEQVSIFVHSLFRSYCLANISKEKTPLYSARGEKSSATAMPAAAAASPQQATVQTALPKLSFKEKVSTNFNNLKDKLITDRSEKTPESKEKSKPKEKEPVPPPRGEGSRIGEFT